MQEIYSEVYEVLRVLGEEYINKIPLNIYNEIEEKRNKKSTYEFNYNIDSLNIESIHILSELNDKYFID